MKTAGKRLLLIVAALTLAIFRPSMLADVRWLRPRAVRAASGSVVLNTNIVATCSVAAVTSNSITLSLSATSADGLPIDYFDIYRDGVWIDRVQVRPSAPAISITP